MKKVTIATIEKAVRDNNKNNLIAVIKQEDGKGYAAQIKTNSEKNNGWVLICSNVSAEECLKILQVNGLAKKG